MRDRVCNRADAVVTADREGAARELDVEASAGVDVTIPFRSEADRRHGEVHGRAGNTPDNDEVQVPGMIGALAVEGRARPARQHCRNALTAKGTRYGGRHRAEARPLGELHRGLPVRRGRRRSAATRR